jgi:hypothetical protein
LDGSVGVSLPPEHPASTVKATAVKKCRIMSSPST